MHRENKKKIHDVMDTFLSSKLFETQNKRIWISGVQVQKKITSRQDIQAKAASLNIPIQQ